MRIGYILEVSELFAIASHDCVEFPPSLIYCFAPDSVSAQQAIAQGEVISVWYDDRVTGSACQTDASWHLNSISEFTFPPKTTYAHDDYQPDTTIYILDTWMDVDHSEFGGRALRGPAYELGNTDYHATHVGALAAGSTFGVNKKANVVSVQVLNDDNWGSWSSVIRGLHWVLNNADRARSIINMSLGGDYSAPLNAVISSMTQRGWKIVVAAGNENTDACTKSPASASGAVTVGAHDKYPALAGFSNWGPCVNINAPGKDILSAAPNGMWAYADGTSMSSPLIAGLWSLYPNLSPKKFIAKISKSDAFEGELPLGTPNRAAYNPRDCSLFLFQQLT